MLLPLKKRAIHRCKIIQGQIQGLEKMIEREDYCVDIITQSLAIQQSLRSLNKILVENHLLTHVKDRLNIKNHKELDTTIEELLNIYELSKVRGK